LALHSPIRGGGSSHYKFCNSQTRSLKPSGSLRHSGAVRRSAGHGQPYRFNFSLAYDGASLAEQASGQPTTANRDAPVPTTGRF
jgi:hypothetical protein